MSRVGGKPWVYKKYCIRCGKLKIMNGKFGKICSDCLIKPSKYDNVLSNVRRCVKFGHGGKK